jgi:hypothetical protein
LLNVLPLKNEWTQLGHDVAYLDAVPTAPTASPLLLNYYNYLTTYYYDYY